MSEDPSKISPEELERLLDGLQGKKHSSVPDSELDAALEDILGDAPKPGRASVFSPAAGSAGQAGTPAARPAASGGKAAAPAPAAAKAEPKKEAIPPEARRPFDVQDKGLELDDNPLVSEDFRRFFTTSITPDALFSSNTAAAQSRTGARAASTLTGGFASHTAPHTRAPRTSHTTLFMPPVDAAVPETPAAPADEEDEPPVKPAPQRRVPHRNRFVSWLVDFFTDEYEVEPSGETVPVSGETAGEAAAEGTENAAAPKNLFADEPEKPSAPEKTAAPSRAALFDNEAAPAPAEPDEEKTPEPAAGTEAEETSPADTAVFERTAAVPAADAEGSTAVFEPAGAAAEETRTGGPDRTGPEAGEETEEKNGEEAAGPSAAQPGSAPAAADEVEEDYTDPSQQGEIAATLHGMVSALTLRAVILGVLAFNALYFGLSAFWTALPQPSGLVSAKGGGVFTLMVYLVSLLIACGVSVPTLVSGARGLWQAPTSDSFALIGCFGALVQNLALLVNASSFDARKQVVFTTFAILSLLAGTLGKRMLACGVQRNFERLGQCGTELAVAALVEDDELVRRLTHGLGETEPYLLVSRRTSFFTDFLHESFAPRAGEAMAQRLCRGMLAAAVLGGLLGVVLGGGFVLPFAGVLCIGCPLSMTLVSAVPNHFMNRSAESIGAILPGARALEDLGQANVVVADARELFPQGSVLLKGMKVFSQARIDLAILYAGSILTPNCPTLRDIFLNIIQNRTEILYKPENLHYEVGCGFEGWADSKHLLVGNRGMMLAHGVEVPPEDYEHRYTKDGRYCPVYLAVNGRLYAMFVVGYRANADVKEMMDEIYVSGLSLLVTGSDFNLTGERIDTVFGIPAGCIKVLGAAECEQLEGSVAYRSRCTGAMVHAPSFKAFIAGIRVAANAAGMEKAASTVQTIAVLFTVLLVLVLTCAGGLGALTLPAVLLYQLGWLLLTLVLPSAKRY